MFEESNLHSQDMNALLAEASRAHADEFNTTCALQQLYDYATRYNDVLVGALEEDEVARRNRLAWKLEQVHSTMQGDVHC
jgi:plexin A